MPNRKGCKVVAVKDSASVCVAAGIGWRWHRFGFLFFWLWSARLCDLRKLQVVCILVFTAECDRFGLIKMPERGDARQRRACFVPAGARERSGLRVIVSGFVIIAREEREIESAAEINKGREREKEIRIPPRLHLNVFHYLRTTASHTHTRIHTSGDVEWEEKERNRWQTEEKLFCYETLQWERQQVFFQRIAS